MQTTAPSANTNAPNYGALIGQTNATALRKQNRAEVCISVTAAEVYHTSFELSRKYLDRRENLKKLLVDHL